MPQRAAAAKKRRAINPGAIEFRRTLIPPCLVTGLGLIGVAVTLYLLPEGSLYRGLPSYIPPTLLGLGVLVLALGGINMATVARDLAELSKTRRK